MKVNNLVQCAGFPCADIRVASYSIPEIDLDPDRVSIVMISEASSADLGDHYYAGPDSLFLQTTLLAFQDAGVNAGDIQDLLALGVYLTTAVKCGKTGYAIKARTVEACSHLLEKELALFPNASVYLLMGDVAIRALNNIARRAGEKRVIPAGSTYKIRGVDYRYQGKRVFPSYLQAGPSFFIEKSKRRMIAEDIANALQFVSRGQ